MANQPSSGATSSKSALAELSGILKSVSDTMNELVSLKSNFMKSDSGGFLEQMAEMSKKASETVSSLEKIGTNMKNLTEGLNVGKVFQSLGGIGEKIGPVFSNIIKGIGPFAKVATGIGIIVGAVVLAIMDIWNTSEDFQEVVGNIFERLKETFGSVAEKIGESLSILWEKLQEFGASLYEFYETSGLKDLVELFFSLGATLLSIVGSLVLEILGGLFSGLADVAGTVLEVFGTLLEFFGTIFGEVFQSVVEKLAPIGSAILDIFLNLGSSIMEWLQSVWAGITDFLIEPVKAAFSELQNTLSVLKDNFTQIFDGIKQILGGVIDFVAGIFTGNWKRAWEGIKSIFKGIVDTFSGIIKAPVNGVIGLVNGLLRGVANGFNKMVDIVNSFKITIPSWLGGGKVGFNLKHWSVPTIPYLAGGGIVNTGQMFIAREAGPEMVGQIGRRTAVANNEQITTAIERAVVNGMMQVMMTAGERSGQDAVIEIPLIVGNEEIARASYKGQLSLDKRYRVVAQFV